jgi:hypothetical protein
VVVLLVLALLLASPAFASPQEAGEIGLDDVKETRVSHGGGRVYSPYAGRDYPDRVFFGDTHFHTRVSFDAGLIGTRIDWHEAFRVARGEKVTSNTGQPVQLIRPLDFLAITDHAEFNGLVPGIVDSDPVLLADPWGKKIHDLFHSGMEGRLKAFRQILTVGVKAEDPLGTDELARSTWRRFVEIADEYNQPGRFTSLTGFEWSSTPLGDNLHRVVLFADGADRTRQTLPFSLFDSEDPEDLWRYMAAYEKKTGGRVLALPHNGNLSNGKMFSDKKLSGEPIDRAYAEQRARWEPLHEMTQIKGDEETHPILSPEDEFADFETWDAANIDGSSAKEDAMLPYEYARSALKLGLQLGAELGANPFKFGLVGATDAHTGLPTSREENYFGKYAHTEPSAKRHDREVIPAEDPELRIMTSQESAAGLMAVWARENNREELFASMTRKEVYATTGTRIRVRVFAGWEFTQDDLSAADFAAVGYGGGVPMGGDLSAAPRGKAPTFLIRALRDPDWANLDRIQVIKGWLDSEGETHERIYDVAVSDGRKIGADGRCRVPVGNTVDVAKAAYTNAIGDATLRARWTDPDFDPKQRAFYYVRVLEIPTPRWTTYDAAFFRIDRPKNVPATTQDRAYTSPIWYTP